MCQVFMVSVELRTLRAAEGSVLRTSLCFGPRAFSSDTASLAAKAKIHSCNWMVFNQELHNWESAHMPRVSWTGVVR